MATTRNPTTTGRRSAASPGNPLSGCRQKDLHNFEQNDSSYVRPRAAAVRGAGLLAIRGETCPLGHARRF